MKRLLLCLAACLILMSCSGGKGNRTDPASSTSRNAQSYEEDSHNDNYSLNWISTPESTCFSHIAYDSWHNVLGVEFRDSGAQYVYYDVENYVWDELKDSYSMGGYYNSDIKGCYDCERIN